MAVTLQNLRDMCYAILREEEDVQAYPLLLIDQLINSAQIRICNGAVINPFTKETVGKGKLPFLNKTKIYSTIGDISLSEATTIGATTLTVSDTTNYATTGTLYINGDKVTYTGKTSTTFTGCDGVTFAHPAGSKIMNAYALPADYGTTINLVYNNAFKVSPIQYDDMFEQLNGVKTRLRSDFPYQNELAFSGTYTILDRANILYYNTDTSGLALRFRYEKLPTDLTDDTDATIIDIDTYAKGTIPYIAIGETFFNRGEEARAVQILNFGLGQLREMYSYYNNSTYEDINGVQYKTAKRGINI